MEMTHGGRQQNDGESDRKMTSTVFIYQTFFRLQSGVSLFEEHGCSYLLMEI